MIIWSRLGFLVAVFVFGCSLLAQIITANYTGSNEYWETHRWPFGVSLLVSASLSWIVGTFLARRGSRVLMDVETGQVVVDTPDDTLFFIKMHWWGPILAAIGVIVIVTDLMK